MCSDLAAWPWWNAISAVGSILGVIATAGIGWYISGYLRISHLKNPASAHFIVPSSRQHTCDFARQNEHEHRITTAVLPTHSICIVDLVIEPIRDLQTTEFMLEFMGDLNTKPYAFEVLNRFIEAGPRRVVVPGEEGNRDYIDKHKLYHYVQKMFWTREMVRAYGFKIKTKDPGTYEVRIHIVGTLVAGIVSGLRVVVQDEPRQLMYCVEPAHMSWSCAAGIRPTLPIFRQS